MATKKNWQEFLCAVMTLQCNNLLFFVLCSTEKLKAIQKQKLSFRSHCIPFKCINICWNHFFLKPNKLKYCSFLALPCNQQKSAFYSNSRRPQNIFAWNSFSREFHAVPFSVRTSINVCLTCPMEFLSKKHHFKQVEP